MLSDIMQAQEDTYRMVHLYVESEKAKSETGWRLPRVGGWGDAETSGKGHKLTSAGRRVPEIWRTAR